METSSRDETCRASTGLMSRGPAAPISSLSSWRSRHSCRILRGLFCKPTTAHGVAFGVGDALAWCSCPVNSITVCNLIIFDDNILQFTFFYHFDLIPNFTKQSSNQGHQCLRTMAASVDWSKAVVDASVSKLKQETINLKRKRLSTSVSWWTQLDWWIVTEDKQSLSDPRNCKRSERSDPGIIILHSSLCEKHFSLFYRTGFAQLFYNDDCECL